MEVLLTTLIGDMDEDDVFFNVVREIEKKIKTMLGMENAVSSSFSVSKKQMVLKINKKIEIIVNMTDFREVETKPLTNMENVMNKYDIDEDELDRIYKNEPGLLEVPEPMMYIHKCNVDFEVGDNINKKYTHVACNFINLMTLIINNSN